MNVPDPDKIHEKRVKLSICNDILAGIGQRKDRIHKIQMDGTDIKLFSQYFSWNFTLLTRVFLPDLAFGSTGTSALMFFHRGSVDFKLNGPMTFFFSNTLMTIKNTYNITTFNEKCKNIFRFETNDDVIAKPEGTRPSRQRKFVDVRILYLVK